MRTLRRWMHTLFAEALAEIGALLRSLDQKPKPRTKR